MIPGWMAYAALVSLLVAGAALAVERACAARRSALRGVWAAAIIASLLFPIVAAVSSSAERPSVPARSQSPGAEFLVEDGAAVRSGTAVPAGPHSGVPIVGDHLERLASRLWTSLAFWIDTRPPPSVETAAAWLAASSSLGLLALCLLGAWRLRRESRGWPRQQLCGQRVLVAPATGPAVLGLLRPEVVLPRWLLTASAAIHAAALAHEREHIAARDPQLWLAALGVLVLMPWNPALWWQLRRLRLAIELDCDRRVLRAGADARAYVQALLSVNRHAPRRGRMPLAGVAMVGAVGWPSPLERRIRAMTAGRPRHRAVRLSVWSIAAVPLLAAAAQLPPPRAELALAASSIPSVAASPRPRLGAVIADADPNPASMAAADRAGALILDVTPGGVADRAGLRIGDTIVAFDGRAVNNAAAILEAMQTIVPGARVHLLVRRGPDELELTADFASSAPGARGAVNPGRTGGPTTTWLPPAVTAAGGDPDAVRDAQLSISQPRLRAQLLRISRLREWERWYANYTRTLVLPPNVPPASIWKTGAPEFEILGPGLRPPVNPGSAQNVRELEQIVAHYGWPTVSMVGYQGAHAAALIAQQAMDDPDFQSKALELMQPLLRTDEVRALDYALLYDSVHTPQRYGSQGHCVGQRWTPSKPVEDPQHLAARRAQLGLAPIGVCITVKAAPRPATP